MREQLRSVVAVPFRRRVAAVMFLLPIEARVAVVEKVLERARSVASVPALLLRSLLRRSGAQPRLVRAVSTRVKRASSSADMLPSSVGGELPDVGVVDGAPVGD
ncbi:hypothetical protein ACQPYH_22885 [Kribbella sp. CA-245084]|uniref:hypothetical protein n=1 Tax=Kribbella sp. CA-245084 TaxID=3239940 RepID=UPI003D8A9D38